MPKLAEPERPCPTRGTSDVSRVDRALKVIPTDGCHRCVRRELVLCEISGGQVTSLRTSWVPSCAGTTRDERLPRVEPGRPDTLDECGERERRITAVDGHAQTQEGEYCGGGIGRELAQPSVHRRSWVCTIVAMRSPMPANSWSEGRIVLTPHWRAKHGVKTPDL